MIGNGTVHARNIKTKTVLISQFRLHLWHIFVLNREHIDDVIPSFRLVNTDVSSEKGRCQRSKIGWLLWLITFVEQGIVIIEAVRSKAFRLHGSPKCRRQFGPVAFNKALPQSQTALLLSL